MWCKLGCNMGCNMGCKKKQYEQEPRDVEQWKTGGGGGAELDLPGGTRLQFGGGGFFDGND